MKKRCQKFLSVLLMISMLVSMFMSTAVFADEQAQGTSTTTNGAYVAGEDGQKVWTPGGSGSVIHDVNGTQVKLSKTIAPVQNEENTFVVTLGVETSTETTVVADAGAVVLVIDTSNSMDYCSNCGASGSQWHDNDCDKNTRQTRLAAAKTAALNFLKTYAGTDATANRELAIVSFSTGVSTKMVWNNVAGGSGNNSFDAAVSAINGLSTSGGTNLDAGLNQALDLLSEQSDIEARSVVVLTDGVPTYRIDEDGKKDYDGSSQTDGAGSEGSAANNAAAANKASAIKNTGAALYTVCYGVADEETYNDGPTVGNFLRDNVASSGCAYNADNTTQLLEAFAAISHAIVKGLDGDGWVVTDPMGDMFAVTGGVSDNFTTTDGQTYKWTLHKSDIAPQGTIATYVYTYSYEVVLNVQDPKFVEGTYYPANDITYVTIDGIAYEFPVPGAKGTLPRTSVTATKVWEDADNQDGLRPESVKVQLLKVEDEGTVTVGEEVTLSVANNWTHTWTDLIEKSGGNVHKYTVKELNVIEGYTPSYSNDGNIWTVTNTHKPETITISGSKTWNDEDNQDGKRPASIIVRLLANGKDTGLVMKLNADYKWVGMFAELPAYENGEKIVYTVTEDAVKDYNTVITGSAEKGFEITNSYTSNPEMGDDSNITLYAALGGVSVAALLAMVVVLKKKKAEEN